VISIAFTGQDGTGKSLQVERLRGRLAGEGARVAVVHQYGATTSIGGALVPPAKAIANRIGLFSRSGSARSEACANAPLVNRKAGWLRRSAANLSLRVGWKRSLANLRRHRALDVLILDRCYTDEIIRAVYKFGHGTELGLRLLARIPAPSLGFSLSVAPETGYERKKTREMSFSEYEEKARVTRDILSAAGRSWNLVSISVDGLTPDDVFDRVWAHVREHLAAVG